MLGLLILCVVVTVFVLLYWLAERFMSIWSCEYLSENKAVLITGCDFNEVAREIAVLLDRNGVPVFACYSNEADAIHLK